jgi:hypothetical protein
MRRLVDEAMEGNRGPCGDPDFLPCRKDGMQIRGHLCGKDQQVNFWRMVLPKCVFVIDKSWNGFSITQFA